MAYSCQNDRTLQTKTRVIGSTALLEECEGYRGNVDSASGAAASMPCVASVELQVEIGFVFDFVPLQKLRVVEHLRCKHL